MAKKFTKKPSKPRSASAEKPVRRVRLINRHKRILSFNLPHDQWCVQRGECSCSSAPVQLTDRDPRTGKILPRVMQRRTPSSITLLRLGRTKPMHPAVLACPEVARALRAREIRSEQV